MLFFNEWRAAARAASAAERLVSQAYLQYFAGKGDPPTAEQFDQARYKRELADDLFAVALRRWRDAGRGPLE